jgi:hypothetical protein
MERLEASVAARLGSAGFRYLARPAERHAGQILLPIAAAALGMTAFGIVFLIAEGGGL